MGKDLLNNEQKKQKAQKIYFGFLIEFKNYYNNMQYTKAVDLIREEIEIVESNTLNEDYDLEILEKLNDLKDSMTDHTDYEVLDKVQKEIDILSTDISISNS